MPLPHESLIAWKRADDLFIRIHSLSKSFPAHERYELGSQSRRAAFSVAANIVEGFARYPLKERSQFLRIALASLAELSYCVHAARRLEYMTESQKEEIDLDLRKVAAPLRGLLQREIRRRNEHPFSAHSAFEQGIRVGAAAKGRLSGTE